MTTGLTGHEPGPTELERICSSAVRDLEADSAAVVLASPREAGAVMATAGSGASDVWEAQALLGVGPSLEVFRGGHMVVEPDVPGFGRWPEFTGEAARLGVRAVVALSLGVGAIRLGVLSIHRARPGAPTGPQLAVALTLADLATSALLDHQAGMPEGALGRGLSEPWRHRAVVHQATGMVAVQMQVPLAEALLCLRAHAYTEATSIYDVCEDVVARRVRFDR